MSSPFDLFRKNQSYWMAGLVLLAILAFIVAPAIDSISSTLRSNSDSGNDVVVRWSDGKITVSTLMYVRQHHARTLQFMQTLAKEVIKNGGTPKVPGFGYNPTNKQIELGLPRLETSKAICQTLIIAERAKQIGMEFDKPVIDDYLVRFCDGKISKKRFNELLKEIGGRELSATEIYRQLGLELTGVVMERVALAGVNYEGMPLVTPGALWQNYLKLNQAARIEAFPVLTSDFIKEVKETPNESQIRTLYDVGSQTFPSPNSPEPGFRRRYQANLEYVTGSWNKFISIEKAKITEEAIKSEYDRLVALKGLQVPVESPDKKPGENDIKAAAPEAGLPPAPASTTTPANEEPKKPEEPLKLEEPKKPAEPDAPKLNVQPAKVHSRLVAFVQTDDFPPPVKNPDPPIGQPGATSVQASESAPTSVSPTDTVTEENKTADSKTGAADAVPMRTQTLEEAKDSISRTLAMNVVRELLQAKMAKIESAMNTHMQQRAMDRLKAENKQKVEKTQPINLKSLAEAEGLTFGSTGMTDGFRLASSPVGRSMTSQQVSLANWIMYPGFELFQPIRTSSIDMSGTEPDFVEFASWKTEDEQAYTPPLTDIRDEVVEAFKTLKARTLARENAEALIAKLKKAGDENWKAVLDAQQQTLVVNPPPFTWMTPPREMTSPAEITFVQGLDSVGQEFMQHVFSTPVGQYTVAANQGQSIQYVVRVVELSPTDDQLRQNFELSRGRARQLAFPERERMFSQWYDNIERMLNVQWLVSDEKLLNE